MATHDLTAGHTAGRIHGDIRPATIYDDDWFTLSGESHDAGEPMDSTLHPKGGG